MNPPVVPTWTSPPCSVPTYATTAKLSSASSYCSRISIANGLRRGRSWRLLTLVATLPVRTHWFTPCGSDCGALCVMVGFAYNLKIGEIPEGTIIMHLDDMVNVSHALLSHIVATSGYSTGATIPSYDSSSQLSPSCGVVAGVIHRLPPAVPTPQTAASPVHPHPR